jgi:hypothetical protein
MNFWGKKAKESVEERHFRVPDHVRKYYVFAERDGEKIRRDLCEAFDRIEAMKLKLWIVGGALLAEGAVIGWLATSLLDCVEAAHKFAALIQ